MPGGRHGRVLEKAVLLVIPGREAEFEQAFAKAQRIVRAMLGCREVTLSRGVEHSSSYLLLISWDLVEAHEIGFLQSPDYQEWKGLTFGA